MRKWAPVAILVATSCGGCDEDVPKGAPILTRIDGAGIAGRAAGGQIGDFLFTTSKAKFVVQNRDTATGWGIYGGSLVDAVPVRADGAEDDRLQEMFVQCDLRAFRPERAEIVNDGADGSPAVLRFTGADAGIPFLDAVLVRDPLEVEMTVDYTVAKDSDAIEIGIRIKDLRKTEAREISCGLVMIRGDDNPIFLDGIGDDADRAGGPQPYVAAAAYDGPGSWVLFQRDRELNVIVAQLGIVPIGPEPVPFLANATVEERYVLAVGARGDVESALEVMRVQKSEPAPGARVSLDVEALPEIERSQVVFTILRDGRPITAAKVMASGPAVVRLEPGMYEASVSAAGRAFESFALDVRGDMDQVHRFVTVGRLHLETAEVFRGAEVGPTPARVWVTDSTGAKVHEQYVEAVDDVLLRSGTYTIYASKGPAHEIWSGPATVAARDTVTVTPRIERVVDLSAWVSIDTHVHSLRSTDSSVSKRGRVLGAVAEGLDVLIATDHDGVTDYGPTAVELGVADRLATVAGVEMSMLYGHMNGFPLAPAPERYWSPSWAVYEGGRFTRMLAPHEVSAKLRENGATIVQANHPRSGQGVFGFVGLDPVTGALTGEWPDIDTAEILNGKRLDEYPQVLADFHALIQTGRRITVTGSSDSHSELSGLGYARTLVKAPKGDLAALWVALKEGRAVAANGPFVFLEAEGGGIGDTIAASGPIDLAVRVEAASWVSADRLVVYENGRSIFETALAPGVVRFQGTVTATPAADSYYMAEVTGGDSTLVDGSKSVTNPIYVDVDGGGFRFAR